MSRFIRVSLLVMSGLLLASCGQFITPVAVLPPSPEYAGLEPTDVGVACAHRVLYVFSFGDSYIRKAKKLGNIKDIATVEVYENSFRLLGFTFYERQCTEVSGYS